MKTSSVLYGFIVLVALLAVCVGVATAKETWMADNILRVDDEGFGKSNENYTIDYTFNLAESTVHAAHNMVVFQTTEDKVKLYALDLLRSRLNAFFLSYKITEIEVTVTDGYTQYLFHQKAGGGVTYEKANLLSGERTKQSLNLAEVEVLLSGPCRCATDFYDCSDFKTWPDAQACYEYCFTQLPGKDVHNLVDPIKEGIACSTYKYRKVSNIS